MLLDENRFTASVNQRVLGSSPRGGAKSLTFLSGFLVFYTSWYFVNFWGSPLNLLTSEKFNEA